MTWNDWIQSIYVIDNANALNIFNNKKPVLTPIFAQVSSYWNELWLEKLQWSTIFTTKTLLFQFHCFAYSAFVSLNSYGFPMIVDSLVTGRMVHLIQFKEYITILFTISFAIVLFLFFSLLIYINFWGAISTYFLWMKFDDTHKFGLIPVNFFFISFELASSIRFT